MSTANKTLTSCAPKTAVAYARYSSAKQRDVSIEQQLADIHAYAEREGYTIIHDYADHAKSGFKHSDLRAEFQAMLRASSTGAFDTVIAWKVDRFGRNRRESSTYKGQLADNGVSVVYAMEPIPDGAAGCLTEGMLEAIAEWYSRNLAENTHRGKMDNANKCLFNGIKIFGYQKGPDGKYAIKESDAAIVRRIFARYSEGASVTMIKNELEQDGIRSENGIPISFSRIIYTLTNEAYLGIYKYEDVRIPGGMPAIIDQDTWDACQLLRAKTYKYSERIRYDFLLSGKCLCSHCGARLTGHSAKGRTRIYYYYVCNNRKIHKCDFGMINQEKLENRIFDFLFDHVLTGDLLDSFIDSVAECMDTQKERSSASKMEEELKDVTRRINNINRAISEGIWTESTADMLNDLINQAETLKKNISYEQMSDLQAISRDRIRFFFRKFTDGSRDDRTFLRTLSNTFINSVTVYDDYLRVVINADKNIAQIPADELPPLDVLPDLSRFDYCSNGARRFYLVEPYPVIAFKIAI